MISVYWWRLKEAKVADQFSNTLHELELDEELARFWLTRQLSSKKRVEMEQQLRHIQAAKLNLELAHFSHK